MPGFVQEDRVSKLRVINPGADSLEVESLSSAMAPPPCYSSYKEGTMTATTVCLEDTIAMEYSPIEDIRNPAVDADSRSIHSISANPEAAAPPTPWLGDETPPSPYSLEDLPKIVHQPELHNYLGPAAPSSTYTHSWALGGSRSQSRITQDMLAITPCDSHTTRTLNSTSDPHPFISPVHPRLSIGHSSTPNISSHYQQGNSQNQLLYRHIPASQPLICRLPYPPNVVNTEPDGEVPTPQEEVLPVSDDNYSSGFGRGFSSTSGSTPFGNEGQGLPMNFVSLFRKSTRNSRTFPLLLSRRNTNSSSIMGMFAIDPYLRLPAGLLKVVDSSGPPLDDHSTSLQPRRKNLVLEAENGGIDVDIQIVPSKKPRRIGASLYPTSAVTQSMMPRQTESRRSTDKRYLQPENQTMRRSLSQSPLVVSEGDSVSARMPTRLDLQLKGHSHGISGKFQLIARIDAPNPRPPIHLVASTIDRAPSTDPMTSPAKRSRLQSRSHPRRISQSNEMNKSPISLHLPHNFRGPLTVYITAGNIDAHVRLSKELSRVAAILSENSVSRGYFISSSGLTEFGGRSRFGEDLEVVMEGEDGWVVVEEMGQSHGVVNNGQSFLSMPRGGGDRLERDEEWYGDKADVFVGDGKVYLQFLDEPDPFGKRKGIWKKLVLGLGCR